jgi:hypothetical protein
MLDLKGQKASDGSMTGARLQTLAAGAELYVDVTLNIKK